MTTEAAQRWDVFRNDRAAAILAAFTALASFAVAPGYGIFRDELYYLACADHLAWGYVDHPPLVAVVAWLVRHSLGTSLYALRLLPALAAGGLVVLAAAIARQLGGGRFAQLLAGLAVALAPVYLSMLTIFSMNAFDLLVWAALCLLVVVILKTEDVWWWIPFGVVAGIGLQNKVSVLFLGFGVAVGLVGARRWRHLRDWRLWLGLGLAGLIFAPHVAWQIANQWPTPEFIRRATATKNLPLAPLDFVIAQLRMLNLASAPLWLGGLAGLLLAPRFSRHRALGIAYLAVLLVMITQNAKAYYLAGFYPVLFAAGAVLLEQAAERERWRWRWLRPVSLVLLVGTGLARAPLAKPLLPVETYVAYAAALGVKPSTDERQKVGRVSQFFADMHGWREMAEAVAEVHRKLPAGERADACIYTQNYGQAGAIDLFGPALGLPRAISGHNNYWLWGPGACQGQVMIIIGGRGQDHARAFAEVTPAAQFQCANCRPSEGDQTLWVVRAPRRTLAQIWPRVKHYD